MFIYSRIESFPDTVTMCIIVVESRIAIQSTVRCTYRTGDCHRRCVCWYVHAHFTYHRNNTYLDWCAAHIDTKYGLIPLSFVRYIDAAGSDRASSATTDRYLLSFSIIYTSCLQQLIRESMWSTSTRRRDHDCLKRMVERVEANICTTELSISRIDYCSARRVDDRTKEDIVG